MSRSTQNFKVRITHDNSLSFYTDQREHLRISFMRTLRIPDDGKDYPLPPGLGRFPIRRVSDYLNTVPEKWLETAETSIFLPIYQREAMWLSFGGPHWLPTALKVCAGRINAVSGESWSEDLQTDGEGPDYLVCPNQAWLDGFNTGDGSIRQFVAMPLGKGYTVEGQVTGKEEHGGVQLRAIPAREGLFQEPPEVRYRFAPRPELPVLNDEAMKRLLNRLTETDRLKPEEKGGIILEAEKGGTSLYQTLESWGCLEDTERVVLEVGCELFEFSEAEFDAPDPELARLIPEDLARRYGAFPVKLLPNNVLVLGMVDPLNLIAVDDFELITGYTVKPMMATRSAVRKAINDGYGVTDLVELEETVKDISAQDFGCLDFGLAAGGTMKQKIIEDSHGIETWDIEAAVAVQIHLVDARTWCRITGEAPPETPVDAELYTTMGYPWYDLYEEHLTDRRPSEILKNVLSVSQMDDQKKVVGMDNSSLWIPSNQIVTYYSSSKPIGKG